MDVVTLALAKKFAKNYTDSHSVTITPELAEQAIANYFADHPEAVVTDDELAAAIATCVKKEEFEDILKSYTKTEDLAQWFADNITIPDAYDDTEIKKAIKNIEDSMLKQEDVSLAEGADGGISIEVKDTTKLAAAQEDLVKLTKKVNDSLSNLDMYTDSFTIDAGVDTYTYSNSLIRENSIIDIYFADNTLDDLKGIEISFVQSEGSLVFNFNQTLKKTLTILTMRISKEIGENTDTHNNKVGKLEEIKTFSFDYAQEGKIELKEEDV